MKPVVIHPDRNYQTKLFIVTLLMMLVAFAWWTIPGVYFLGREVGGTGTGLLLTVVVNGAAVVIALLLIPVYYHSLRYEIHEDEVIVIVGVVTRSIKHVPFRTVTNLQVTRGPFDRLLGIGSLAIQTAGMSGTTGAEEKLVGLVNVQQVYEYIAGELRRFRGALTPTQTGDELAPAPTSEPEVLTAILAELRAIHGQMDSKTPG